MLAPKLLYDARNHDMEIPVLGPNFPRPAALLGLKIWMSLLQFHGKRVANQEIRP
jgi:hypothetical protein